MGISESALLAKYVHTYKEVWKQMAAQSVRKYIHKCNLYAFDQQKCKVDLAYMSFVIYICNVGSEF